MRVLELIPCPTVAEVVGRLAGQPELLVLESVLRRPGVGRYSYVMADPIGFECVPRVTYGSDPFANSRKRLSQLSASHVPELPPFQGGVAGLLAYEAGRVWERLPPRQIDEFELPEFAAGIYDWVIAWDHATGRAWIVSQGWPEADPRQRMERAQMRMEQVQRALSGAGKGGGVAGAGEGSANPQVLDAGSSKRASALKTESLTPQFAAPGLEGLTSNFSRDGYLRGVERVIEYIRAGDIFQANLSQRLLAPLTASPMTLYERLRDRNPATFAGYFACDDWAVVSASPERFVCVRDGEVETRPIKGTRRRRSTPEADLFTGDELRESEKDRAENVMIVDLLRNDLSRVCEPGSIRVPKLCAVETYETVQHLVSEIRGRLSPGSTAWDLLAATFPGGSITGAPKVRAMEIINELEPTVRGPYCGSLFCLGADGALDSNILIRTLVCRRGWVQCSVGGGIVAQSDPVREYEETLHKAEGMLRALR
ncbi:MAG: aminodeoxychorismate synthase component I [Planctomycetaceae bacterium]|nr:aminodeoxychorismate synthase component I [Planctomycetaceae bacterium]